MLLQADLKARLRIETERGRNSVDDLHRGAVLTLSPSKSEEDHTAQYVGLHPSNLGIHFIRLKAQSNGPRRVAESCCRYIHSPATGKRHLSAPELGRYERTTSHHEYHLPPLTLTSSVLI